MTGTLYTMSMALQVYVNTESRQYLVRVWGKTRERGDFQQASELQTLCRNVFARRVACAGYLVSQYDFHFGDDFVFVDYPCQRQISRCCELAYRLPEEDGGPRAAADEGGAGSGGVGMCAQCSSVSDVAEARRMKHGDSDDDDSHFLEPKVTWVGSSSVIITHHQLGWLSVTISSFNPE